MTFDPNKPYKCRDGSVAHIANIYQDNDMDYPIIGRKWSKEKNKWTAASWRRNGIFYSTEQSSHDLVNEPETFTRYVNLWQKQNDITGKISWELVVDCNDPERMQWMQHHEWKLIGKKKVTIEPGEGL